MFNNYISLGNNCEVAFQIRRVLGHDSSSFFSWNVTNFAALRSLLKNDFDGIMQDSNIFATANGNLLLDKSHNYEFHSPFTSDFRSDPNFSERYVNLRSKFDHFVSKFRALKNDGTTAFFYKTEQKEEVKRECENVRDLLYNYFPSRNFRLIVIQQESMKEEDWGADNMSNRYLKRIAPWNDATDGHVSSWDKIFREFPSNHPLRLSGY